MKRLCSITTYTYTLHNVLRYQIDPLFPSVQPVGDPCPYLTKKYFFLVGYLLKYFKSVKILFRDKLSNFGLQSFGSPEVLVPPATVATPLVETNRVFENRNGYKWTWR